MSALPAVALLCACADAMPLPTAPPADAEAMAARAQLIGELVRGASACGVTLTTATQDRAARIEIWAIEAHLANGGPIARDAFLASMRPPAPPRRAAWCGTHRTDILRMASFLDDDAGEALAARADAARGAVTDSRPAEAAVPPGGS